MGTRFGRYRILDEVGQGAMGIVYRARDARLDREVALKVLRRDSFEDAGMRRRFETEARLLSKLNHPNIEILYDAATQDDDTFLVMEFIRGETLQHRLARGALPVKECIDLGIQLCSALEAAHAAGIVHRDLKPGNLMVTPEGGLKVLDFGLAKYLRSSDQQLETSGEAVTQTGTVVGTIPYLTPEQLRGEDAEARSDIHCVGAILYEMATGRRPYTGQGTALMASILNDAPTPPRSINARVTEALQAVILRCLEKRPQARFQSAADLGAALRALGSAEKRHARRRRYRRAQQRQILALAAAAVAVLAVIALLRIRSVGDGVAVLPFQILGDDSQKYYADAVSDQLISKLVGVSDLPVTPRTSARSVDTNQPLPAIANSLGVSAVVDGTVLRADGTITVNIWLSRVQRKGLLGRRSVRLVYAGEREFAEADLFKELGAFATSIAERLVTELKPEDRERLVDARQITPPAFDSYARGRHEWSRRTPQAFQNAIQFFQESVRLDSTFALAYAGLADCYALFGSLGYDIIPPQQAMPQARIFAEKALHYDPTLAEAHTALAHIHHNFDWDWAAAAQEFERAMELAPGDPTPYQWYGFYLATLGRLDEAIEWQQQALQMEPGSAVLLASLGRLYYYARDLDTAVEYLERALERDRNFLPATIALGAVYTELERYEDAGAIFEAGRVVTDNAAVFEAGVGAVQAASGNLTQARRVIEALRQRSGYVPAYYIAAIYTKLGDQEGALEWLGRAVDERSEAVLYLAVDPWLDDLRLDARFHELLRRVGLPNPAEEVSLRSRSE